MTEEKAFTREEILSKIKKIQASERSAREVGNTEEAEVFAGLMQKLLHRYELSMTEVEFSSMREEIPVGKHQVDWSKHGRKIKHSRIRWEEDLAHAVCVAYGCSFLVHSGTNCITLLGRKANCELAEHMLVVLITSAEKIAKRAYNTEWTRVYREQDGDTSSMRGWTGSFLQGFVRRISEKFLEEVEGRKNESSTCTALVRVQTELKDVAEWIGQQSGIRKASSLSGPSDFHAEGYAKGKKVADEIGLRKGIKGTVKTQPQLR